MDVALLYLLTLVCSVQELDEAREHYQEMKYGLALKSLAKAITLPGISRADRAQIYLLTALCRHQQGDIKG